MLNFYTELIPLLHNESNANSLHTLLRKARDTQARRLQLSVWCREFYPSSIVWNDSNTYTFSVPVKTAPPTGYHLELHILYSVNAIN